jgi:hypothetical protein
MRRLALVGYGKMGRMLESMAEESGFEVVLRLDVDNNANGEGFTAGNFKEVDVAIEFTAPAIAPANLLPLARLGVPTVCGTTGWFDRLDEIAAAFNATGAPLVYGPNFSIGVNLFARVVAEAARLMATQPAYEAWAWEIHHWWTTCAPPAMAPISTSAPTAPAAFPAPTKSDSTRRPTPSPCATPPAVAKVSPEARSGPPNGSAARPASTRSAGYCLRIPRSKRCFKDAEQLW